MMPKKNACERCQLYPKVALWSLCEQCIELVDGEAAQAEQVLLVSTLRKALIVARGGFVSLSHATEFSTGLAPLHQTMIDEVLRETDRP